MAAKKDGVRDLANSLHLMPKTLGNGGNGLPVNDRGCPFGGNPLLEVGGTGENKLIAMSP